jgi:transcriptional regulator with XRE-family HTH domain
MKAKSINKNWSAMADPAIVKDICTSVKQMRLNKNLSQSNLAKMSGIHPITMSHMETGRSVSLLTLIQVLRALDKLDVFNLFFEETEISPMQLLKIQEKQRRKASPKKKPINKRTRK